MMAATDIQLTSQLTSTNEATDGQALQCKRCFNPDAMNMEKIKEATFHAVITLVVALALLALACVPHLSLAHLVGISYLAIFMFYLVNILCEVYSASRIYRIYSIFEMPPQWATMPIVTRYVAYEEYPIVSISEFSAIGGGKANMLLARLGSYAFAIIITFVCTELKRNTFEHFPVSLAFESLGAFGVVLIGTYYDDPYSMGMRIGHYVGVALSCFTLIGFLLQRIHENEHIWMAILLIVVFVAFFLLFMLYPSYPSKDPSQVTMVSLRQITFEAVALSTLTIAAGLYFVLYTF